MNISNVMSKNLYGQAHLSIACGGYARLQKHNLGRQSVYSLGGGGG